MDGDTEGHEFPQPLWLRIRDRVSVSRVGKRARLYRSLLVLGVLGTLRCLIILLVCLLPPHGSSSDDGRLWLFVVLDIHQQLSPTIPESGYKQILQEWKSPSKEGPWLPARKGELGGDITPVPCHSHNDYWRRVPLYDALAVGCTGVEADIWLGLNASGNEDLLVGHSRRALTSERTMSSLYIDPLVETLDHQNQRLNISSPKAGVYDLKPNASLALMLDFKENGTNLWPTVPKQIEPLRRKGYLCYRNGPNGPVVSRQILQGRIIVDAIATLPGRSRVVLVGHPTVSAAQGQHDEVFPPFGSGRRRGHRRFIDHIGRQLRSYRFEHVAPLGKATGFECCGISDRQTRPSVRG